MNAQDAPERHRAYELMADLATEGLEPDRQRELIELQAKSPYGDREALDRAAAAVDVAIGGRPVEPIPEHLRSTILFDAGAYFAGRKPDLLQFSSQVRATVPTGLKPGKRDRFPGSRTWSFAWYLAAASLVVAVTGWWQALAPEDKIALDQQYQAFQQSTPDLVRADWVARVHDYSETSGEILWSDREQAGFMRFVGMPPNQPTQNQYQLWIVDPDRDKHPIDGGVFDVESSGEVIVPIDPKLVTRRPTLFAITLEQPGGVVVSDGPFVVVAEPSRS